MATCTLTLGVLAVIADMVRSSSAVDHGHRHSAGSSIIQLWLSDCHADNDDANTAVDAATNTAADAAAITRAHPAAHATAHTAANAAAHSAADAAA